MLWNTNCGLHLITSGQNAVGVLIPKQGEKYPNATNPDV